MFKATWERSGGCSVDRLTERKLAIGYEPNDAYAISYALARAGWHRGLYSEAVQAKSLSPPFKPTKDWMDRLAAQVKTQAAVHNENVAEWVVDSKAELITIGTSHKSSYSFLQAVNPRTYRLDGDNQVMSAIAAVAAWPTLRRAAFASNGDLLARDAVESTVENHAGQLRVRLEAVGIGLTTNLITEVVKVLFKVNVA